MNTILQKYDKLKEKGVYSDKYLVKKYIEEKHPHINFAKTLYSTTDPNDIKKFKLPADYVMKYSSGSRAFQVIRNNKCNLSGMISTAKEYMKIDYGNQNYRKIPFLGLQEPQYNYNEKRIIFEEFLGENIYEFRIIMVKGKILYYEMIRPDDYGCQVFDPEGNKMYVEIDEDFKIDKSKKMLNITKLNEINKFCEDFYEESKIDFVRVDFYIDDNLDDYYFGELTFTPDNCRKSYNKGFNDRYHYKT